MGEFIYFAVLVILMAANVYVNMQELREIFSSEKIKHKKAQLEKYIFTMVPKRKRSNLERELFNSSVTLKNLSIVRRETPISADYIYERLAENGGRLRPVYSRMLALYRAGNDEEAFRIVASEIGTKAAKNFAYILSKLDKMNPAQLVLQMEMFQETMTESAMTGAMKKAQRNSVIITACASMSIFALLINFTVVVVFMNTIEILNGIFI